MHVWVRRPDIRRPDLEMADLGLYSRCKGEEEHVARQDMGSARQSGTRARRQVMATSSIVTTSIYELCLLMYLSGGDH